MTDDAFKKHARVHLELNRINGKAVPPRSHYWIVSKEAHDKIIDKFGQK